jgi:tetratricopeptide (TPR) repeat protein
MVRAWREIVTIPTYEVGKPEKNPIFLEKRVYQGSSGGVYPYPVIESISDEKVDKDYKAVFIENEYIKVMVLPELGGRVQMAYDKIAKRHFVYYNHVIKPALVGLLGPWISGGIEFNWPQHHRPSTFMPADCTIEEGEDGGVTVWVSEMEKMFHQKGMAGFTLRPGCAYLEIHGVLYNRTDVPQTFLWWANPAVEVNDAYQSVFPPDINAVFDHGKRAVSSFPIATGTYYKMDYSAGVDISNYKNIYVPTSYMGVNSRFNFEGGYENDTKAGMLHVASHHFSPGKKQWTWGNGDFGRAWDRNLTDEATPEEMQRWGLDRKGFRPYIELMAGVYTENQPDFSWLMPYEEKQFTQYFMPYRELGVVKEASKDLVMNINEKDGKAEFKIFATNKQDVHIILVTDSGETLYDQKHTVSPEAVLTETVGINGAKLSELNLKILKDLYGSERTVMHWHAESDEIRPIPDSAEAALLPEEVKTNEQLFLTGLHLEQYRHATWSPVDYYEEALRRDPNDVRCLNALGLWYIRKCRFGLAEGYLRKAVRLITKRNPNPYDSEPIYNLALALKYQGQYDEAYELFWKSTWSKACADAGYFEASKISVMQGRLDDALDELNRCLIYGAHNQKALALKAAVLRKIGRKESAAEVCKAALKTDLFNYGCRYELYLLTGKKSLLDEMTEMLQGLAKNYDELALDYQAAGLNDEAKAIWDIAVSKHATSPMTYYYLGRYDEAEQALSDYCFPNRAEDVIALESAKRENPDGSMAPYYLVCRY